MSQAKVDKYKEEKKNRKDIVAQSKRNEKLLNAVLAIVLIVIIAWIGYSGYSYLQRNKEANVVTTVVDADTSAIDNFITSAE